MSSLGSGTALVLVTAVAIPVVLTLAAWLVGPRLVPRAAVIAALAALLATLVAPELPAAPLVVSWVPQLGVELRFELDALASIYAFIATAVGLAVAIYSLRYMARHRGGPDSRRALPMARFHALLAAFLAGMVGLALSADLLVAFVFFDLTAVTSYFLIGFERHEAEARRSAFMALLVTGISSLPMLVGILWLGVNYGTFSIAGLSARVQPGLGLDFALGLIALAAIAKSAQVPLHFWLPRAMVAPTPVSAYLHSAAMVAVGVFVLSRIYPLLSHSPRVQSGLLVIGGLSVIGR